MAVDPEQWERELASHDALFARVGSKQPPELAAQRGRLGESPRARIAARLFHVEPVGVFHVEQIR